MRDFNVNHEKQFVNLLEHMATDSSLVWQDISLSQSAPSEKQRDDDRQNFSLWLHWVPEWKKQ